MPVRGEVQTNGKGGLTALEDAGQFRLVDLRHDADIMHILRQAEQEIKRRCGRNVALIAYTDADNGTVEG
jgi:hypothetical protein